MYIHEHICLDSYWIIFTYCYHLAHLWGFSNHKLHLFLLFWKIIFLFLEISSLWKG